MIEPEDLMIPGTSVLQQQLGTSDIATFDRAVADSITSRLTGLQSMPVQGAFDANHLQQIHAHIFQDAFPWAGQFREQHPSPLTSSLDMLFDRLAQENRLKGLGVDAWSNRSSEYLHEIARIEPFIGGTDLASLEFFRELAGENNMNLRWVNATTEPSEELQVQVQKMHSNNLRRILMLAVDPGSSIVRPSQCLDARTALERFTSFDWFL